MVPYYIPLGQTFTVPVDIRLVRPVQQTAGPLVRVQLDGVLFDDLSFFGPNKLNSQRAKSSDLSAGTENFAIV